MYKLKEIIIQRFYTEGIVSNSLAILVGILTGIVFVFYEQATFFATRFFFGKNWGISWYVIVLPAFGGLLIGLLSHRLSNKRCGIPDVIEATALHGGKIPAINAFYEVFLSIISISTGGSVGKEAPGVLAGTGVGSSVAGFLKSPDNRFRTLISCGASGGIAAAFNAPLAGVVFVVEVIIGKLESKTFIPVVLSAVFAALVSTIVFKANPIQVSYYGLVDPLLELVLYVILGAFAGIVSVILIKTTYFSHDIFQKMPTHPILKPAIGGLGVGFIGYSYPQVFGIGYATITSALEGELVITLLIYLLILKIIAFSLTVGSGGSGGAIVPSLFVGSMMGGAFGIIVNVLFPASTAPSGAYALVGMGAVFAGTAHAPLTAMLILFELTRDYNLILPLMAACVISKTISSSLQGDSIFTETLRRRGHSIRDGTEINVMEAMKVSDNMVKDVLTLNENDTAADLLRLMQKSKHAGFPVLNQNGQLVGIVTLHDMRDKVPHGELGKLIKTIATKDVVTAYPDESLDVVLKRLAARDIGRLPVVSRGKPDKLLGIITRSDIVKSYNREIIARNQQNKPK
ncbi:chloride channel protein [Methanohalophilus sp.]|uniref:chloride channel protein n=1 Tax=Methanohalophilus sp. TaxID=1966352 RepID=UPI002614D265|nr:chloride channel protein [Methanohalophilus sp.]MDK2893142.1 chloride channel protein family [Methanohalophilus sp.]